MLRTLPGEGFGGGGRKGVSRAMPATSLARRQSSRVAYLVNVYPKVSHSFIQTEIGALERLGFAVDRFSIRRPTECFATATDRQEQARTTVLLDGNVAGLLKAFLRRLANQPLATGRALFASLRGGGAANIVRRLAYVLEAAGLADELQRRGIRHVHAHFGTNSAQVARLAARLGSLTYSFTAHGPDEFDAPALLDLRGKIADAAFVAGVSEYGRGQLMRWSNWRDWPRIQVVRCAVDPTFTQSQPEAERAVPADRLVCVARLSAQKGLPLLLEAVAAVAAHRDVSLRLIGDGEERAGLEDRVRQLGLQDRIAFLGWREPAAVRDELLAARALVLPSFAEGLPVVLMEAMALGLPVITTAIAGIPELVDDKVGWLVPTGSEAGLRTAIEACLDASPEHLRAMGQVGRLRVLRHHDAGLNAAELAKHLRPLLEASALL